MSYRSVDQEAHKEVANVTPEAYRGMSPSLETLSSPTELHSFSPFRDAGIFVTHLLDDQGTQLTSQERVAPSVSSDGCPSPVVDQGLPIASRTDFDFQSNNYGAHSTLTSLSLTLFEAQSTVAPSINRNNHTFDVPSDPQRDQAACGTYHTNASHGLSFNSLDEAVAAIPAPDWNCPLNDTTVPTNDAHRVQWVSKLLAALSNTENVYDKQTLAFKKRWLNQSYYIATDKEILCWDILNLAERLHRDGPVAFRSFEPRFFVQARKTRGWTFEHRMEKIIILLTSSKARCERLLGGLGMQLVVGNPSVLLSNTKGNVKQNGKRQAFLEAGREMKVKTELGTMEHVADEAATDDEAVL